MLVTLAMRPDVLSEKGGGRYCRNQESNSFFPKVTSKGAAVRFSERHCADDAYLDCQVMSVDGKTFSACGLVNASTSTLRYQGFHQAEFSLAHSDYTWDCHGIAFSNFRCLKTFPANVNNYFVCQGSVQFTGTDRKKRKAYSG